MKIRPDFVTNSSSSSYEEVIIDNPVLLEILAKYKALGMFGVDEAFTKCEYTDVYYFEIGDWLEPNTDLDIKTLTPAFHAAHQDGSSWIYPPSSLDEVLEHIIDVIEKKLSVIHDVEREVFQRFFDEELYQKLCEELRQSADDINNSFIAVKWFSREDLYDGRFQCWEFRYDREHGEDYYEEETGNMDW